MIVIIGDHDLSKL